MQQPEDPIRIGDKEYKFADMTPAQQDIIQQIVAIDTALDNMDAQMGHAKAARETYFRRLNSEMETDDGTQETGLPQEPADA